jgi:hypothetical protein
MESEKFDSAVATIARRQAERLRGMGFLAAAAELDSVLPGPADRVDEESQDFLGGVAACA